MTVEDLFDVVSGSHADAITATCDPTYGYPSSVSVDPSRTSIDEDLGCTLSRFAPA